jgi:hypothetical protein
MFMMNLISAIGGISLVAAISLAATPALGAACAPHDEFSKHLATNYNDQSEGVGVANDGSLFEIFTSENGTWSLLITNGKKISCIVAAGDMWVTKPALGPEASIR